MMDSVQESTSVLAGATVYYSHRAATHCPALLSPSTSPASLEMAFELWKDPAVIAASVLLLIIARVAYKRDKTTGRPPMVSYAVPWVGSAIDLGKNPDAFFKRAMYVE